jgi:DNA-binding NtrC family response regulator
MKKMLVIDDSLSVRESLRIIFQDTYRVEAADPWQDIRSLLMSEKFDLVLLGLGGKAGQEIDVLKEIAALDPQLPLIALVEEAQREDLEVISSSYITDLVVKPFNVFELREKVKHLQEKTSVSSYVRSPLKMKHIFQQQKIYFSPAVRHKLSEVTIRNKGASLIPVLLCGEGGTGREIAAKWLHFRGSHMDRAFLKIHASNLMEETFMHSFLIKEKGGFRPKSLGTVYLEEIEKLRLNAQERLMEIIDEGSVVTPEGREVAINFRAIASTSQDLREQVYKRALKEELFYKLNVISVYFPPLRERREEIPEIAQQILESSAQRFTLKAKGFTADALETLKNYYWPGNVRELESVLVRSLVCSSKEMISTQDLQFGIEERAVTHAPEEENQVVRKSFMEVVKPERSLKVKKETFSPEKGDAVFKELVTELAHEIKNPLVAIKTFTQLLPERFDDEEFREQFSRITGESVDRIDQLIEKILGSARFSRPSLTQVDLHTLLENSLANAACFGGKRVVCKKELKKNLPLIFTDEEQIQYVFGNILSSISALITEGSEVSFSTRTVSLGAGEKDRSPLGKTPNGHAVELSISYPGNPEREKVSGHYSIELFLAQQIIEKNLGLMEVSSSSGKTAITIKLPVATGGSVGKKVREEL